MAVLLNYIPTLHDIYLFNGQPEFDRLNPPGPKPLVGAIGLNPNFILKNETLRNQFKLDDVDFSGLHVRPRGFQSYGWSFLDPDGFPSPYAQFAGSKPLPFSRTYEHPLNITISRQCITEGCPPGNFDIVENYNFWNNGNWAGILISPEHVLVCGHYSGVLAGVNLVTEFNFLGKNGQFYRKTARARASTFWNEYDPDAPEVIPLQCTRECEDFIIYKLDSPITMEEREQIKIYPIVDVSTIPFFTTVYGQDPNGKLRLGRVLSYSPPTSQNPNEPGGKPYAMVEYNTATALDPTFSFLPRMSEKHPVHVGDSGTPYLMSINGETCVYGLHAGGNVLDDWWVKNVLKEFIKNDTVESYDIRIIDAGFNSSYLFQTNAPSNIETPLTQFPYSSSFPDTINKTQIAFDQLLHCQDLNSLQDQTFNYRSKTIELIANYFGNNLLSSSTNNGPVSINSSFFSTQDKIKSILDAKIKTITPLNRGQINLNTAGEIVMNPGWYFIKSTIEHFTPIIDVASFNRQHDAYEWFYNSLSYTFVKQNNKCLKFDIRSFASRGLKSNTDQLSNRIYLTNNDIAYEYFDIPASGTTLEGPVLFYTDSNGISYLANGTRIS